MFFENFATHYIYFKAWEVLKGIRIEGLLLTCEGTKSCRKEKCFHGARYIHPFSPDFPHFEVGNGNIVHEQVSWYLEINLLLCS